MSGALSVTATLLAAAALSGSPAYADDNAFFNAAINDATIGVAPAPGKAIPLFLFGQNVANPKVVIDTSALAGVATIDTPKGCSASGTTITCTDPALAGSDVVMPLVVHPASGAAAGANGTVAVTTSGDNVDSTTTSSKITLADGVDLVVTSGFPIVDTKVGSTVSVAASFANAGSKSAVGTVITFFFDHGLIPADYTNCTYFTENTLHGAACDFPDTIAPGDEVQLDGGFGATVAKDASKYEAAGFLVSAADEQSVLPQSIKPKAHAGSTKTLKIKAKSKKKSMAAPPKDIDQNDNYGGTEFNVTNAHGDVAAVGTTASGALNAVVKVTVGAKNVGPAALDSSHSGEPALTYVFVVPTDTTTVAVPSNCDAVIDDNGTQHNEPGKVGESYYRCYAPTVLIGAGESTSVTFSLKITKVTPDAKGSVTLNDKYRNPVNYADDNANDNTADVIINPSTGGSGGGLPVTGAPTGLIAAGGALLLVVGAGLVLMSRRRAAQH